MLMTLFWFVIVERTAVKTAATVTTLQLNDQNEVCENEWLKIRCAYDEVIVMKTALYGRMHLGRCVKFDMGYLGCQANVLDLADYKCSGRRSCEIRVPDPDFEATAPCLELKSFLEATFVCLKVLTTESAECRRPTSVRLPTLRSPPTDGVKAGVGRIASLTTQETGWCGTDKSPWIIEVQPGQRINITLLDFGLQSGRSDALVSTSSASSATGRSGRGGPGTGSRTASGCQIRYAVIRERPSTATTNGPSITTTSFRTSPQPTRSVEVCGGQGSRDRHVYLSQGHVVEVMVDMRRDSPDYFVLSYEAVDCADPTPLPPGAWLRRETHDVVVIGCSRSTTTTLSSNGGERWRLACVDGQWRGDEIGNCTSSGDLIVASEMRIQPETTATSSATAAAVVVICIVASLAAIIGSSVGLVLLLKRKQLCTGTGSKSTADELSDHPVSPKSLVTEVGDDGVNEGTESYLRPTPTVGCHGDPFGGQTIRHHRHRQQQQQQQQQQQLQQLHPYSTTIDQTPPQLSAADRFNTTPCRGECCRIGDAHVAASVCRTPTLAAKSGTTRPKQSRQNLTGGDGGCGRRSDKAVLSNASPGHVMPPSGTTVTGYQRATSCIEVNKYTHIWEMPLPVPGE